MKARHLIMVAALGVAAWLALFGDKTPSGAVTEHANTRASVVPVGANSGKQAVHNQAAVTSPLPTTPTRNVVSPSNAGKAGADNKQEVALLSLLPRENLIGGAHADHNASHFFGNHDWTPPPPPLPPPPPPPPPTAPALPFTYIGKKSEDGQWEVYLARGEQTYIVQENASIDGTYHVDKIDPPNMTLTYMPLKQQQNLQIGEAK